MEEELARMTLEELLKTEPMQEYLRWVWNKKGDFKARVSRRIRRGARRVV